MKGRCEICGHDIGQLEEAAYPVSGWEPDRKKGANQIILRQREPNRIAHITCLRAQAHRNQVSMDLGSAA